MERVKYAGIYFYALFAFLAGIFCFLVAPLTSDIFLYISELFPMIGWASFLFFLFLGTLSITAAYGLIRRRAWSKSLINELTFLLLVLYAVSFGFYKEWAGLFALFLFFIITVLYFNIPAVRDRFSQAGRFDNLTFPLFIFIILTLVGYSAWISYGIGGNKFNRVKEVKFSSSKKLFPDNFFYPALPYKYQLAVPHEIEILTIRNYLPYGKLIWCFEKEDYSRPGNGFIQFKDASTLSELLKIISLRKYLNSSNTYDLVNKFYYEKSGLLLSILSQSFMQENKDFVEHGFVNGFEVFVFTQSGQKGLFIDIFNNEEFAGEVTFVSKIPFSRSEIEKIVATIKPNQDYSQNALYFYKLGERKMRNKQYSEAGYCYLSALYRDWDNPRFHYSFARSIIAGTAESTLTVAVMTTDGTVTAKQQREQSEFANIERSYFTALSHLNKSLALDSSFRNARKLKTLIEKKMNLRGIIPVSGYSDIEEKWPDFEPSPRLFVESSFTCYQEMVLGLWQLFFPTE